MIDLINEYREAVTNILRWRNNPKEVFLNNIVKNMMYRAYSTRLVFDAYLNNELPEYKDFQEAAMYVREFYGNVATQSVHPYLLKWMENNPDEKVGTIVASRYLRMAHNALLDPKAKEELEFSYIFELLNDMCAIYYIAFRICGESQISAISKMTGAIIAEMPEMNYTITKQVFQQLLVAKYMNDHYHELP